MKSLVIFAICISVSYAIVCPPDTCARIRCAGVNAETCHGVVKNNAGYCGCCPACVQQVEEGKLCMSSLILLGVPQNSECGDGLFCNRTSGRCQKKTCALHLQEVQGQLNAAKQSGKPLVGTPVPRCETDGTYSPVQCSGSVCYCANKEGEQIFRDKPNNLKYQANVWEQNGMNCRCAVEQEEYMRKGLIGRMFYCSANGNYASVGCTGYVCYCTDEHGQQVGSKTVHTVGKDLLNC